MWYSVLIFACLFSLTISLIEQQNSCIVEFYKNHFLARAYEWYIGYLFEGLLLTMRLNNCYS
jgi:hypothetical protein